MAVTDIYTVAGSLEPFKHGCRFLGGNVDDQIQVNAAAAAVGNVGTKGAMACWLMVPDDAGTYTAVSFGDASAVEYAQITVEAGTIQFVLVDATTTHIDVNTPANSIKPHTWYHVCVVQDGSFVKVYIDGEEQTLTVTTGGATAGSWFKDCVNLDSGSIGCAEMAGDGSLTQEFKGYISQVAIWSGTAAAAALSADEVKRAMHNPEGVEATYLHNYWPLDGDALDHGTGADNGTIVGDIIYVSANEFASRLSFGMGTPVVADHLRIAINEKIGMAYLVQAA
jgi:hypothetical protein